MNAENWATALSAVEEAVAAVPTGATPCGARTEVRNTWKTTFLCARAAHGGSTACRGSRQARKFGFRSRGQNGEI